MTFPTKLAVSVLASLAMVACGSGSDDSDTQTGTDQGQKTDVGDTFDAAVDSGVQDTGTKQDIPVKKDDGTPNDPGTPMDLGPKDPGPPPTGGCAEIGSCALLCDSQACIDQCRSNEDVATKALLDSMLTCLNGLNCGPLVGPGGFVGCAIDACADEIAACYVGSGECNDIRKCRIDCATTAMDYSCALLCFAEGTKDAQDLFQNYADCIFGKEVDCSKTDLNANGWPVNDCEKFAQGHYCPLQTQACIPPH